jgi:hypothetical protein
MGQKLRASDNSAAISVSAFSVAWAHLGLDGFALAVENGSQQRLLGPIYKIETQDQGTCTPNHGHCASDTGALELAA